MSQRFGPTSPDAGGFVTSYGRKLKVTIDASATDESPGAIQAFKDECDINNIMLDVVRQGTTEWLSRREGTYEDVTGVDFQSCMDTVLRAQQAFDDLPADLRDRFANDPERFLNFVHDPRSAEEMLRLGLRNPPPAPPAPVAPPAS